MSAAIFQPGLTRSASAAGTGPAGSRACRAARPAATARHARPHAEIDRVAPHHPAQKQVEPLARAARGGPRKEVARRPRGAGRRAAVGGAEDRWPARASRTSRAPSRTSRRRRIVAGDEEGLDRPALPQHLPQDRAAARRGRGRGSSGAPAARAACVASGLERRGRTPPGDGPITREQRFDRLQHARHAAERERRGAEARQSRDRPAAANGGRCGPDRSPSRTWLKLR